MDNKAKIFVSVLVALIVVVLGVAVYRGAGSASVADGKYDGFAQCLKESGITFYGAFWCPHCQAQKKMFGNSAKLLPYVECSTLDAKSQLPVCQEAGIESYPTWKLADGTIVPNENGSGVSLETLAAKTSCELPTDIEPIEVEVEEGSSPAQ